MIARLLALLAAAALPAFAQQDGGREAEETLSAIVRVKARILPNARSAPTLGLLREGSGVIVREGFVATIGYLVLEAEAIEVTGAGGKAIPAALAGYDHASGFGVLRLLRPLPGRPLPLGDAAALAPRAQVMVASHGEQHGIDVVHVVARRPFSGSWEYLLESAIFTYPPVMNWSGAALIDSRGALLGLGSLIVADVMGPGTRSPGNMFVPVDLLKPILEDLIAQGRAAGPARPWLGIYAEELRGRLFVARVSPDGPAARAGVKDGDIVLGVGDAQVSSLEDFYRRVWARGAAGVDVPLRLLQGAQPRDLTVRSIDRAEYFRQRPNY